MQKWGRIDVPCRSNQTVPSAAALVHIPVMARSPTEEQGLAMVSWYQAQNELGEGNNVPSDVDVP